MYVLNSRSYGHFRAPAEDYRDFGATFIQICNSINSIFLKIMIHCDSLNTRICKYCQQRCKLSIYLDRVTGVGPLNNFFLFWTTFYSTLKRRLRAFHFPERSTNGNILPTKNLSDETIHWINRALNDICRQLKNWQTIKETKRRG